MNKALLWVAVGVGVLVLLSRRAAAAPVPDTTAGSGPPRMLSGSKKAINVAKSAAPVVRNLSKVPLTNKVPTHDVAVTPSFDPVKTIGDLGNAAIGFAEGLLKILEVGEKVTDKLDDAGIIDRSTPISMD